MCQWCVSCQWPFITNKSETFSTSPEQCFYDLGPPFRRSAIPGYYCYNNPNPNPNPNPRIPGMAGSYRLYTTLWSLKCSSRTCYHRVVRESNSKNSSHLNCDLQFRHIWILLITACIGILREKVHKTCIYRRRHWRLAAAMTTWSSLAHSILSRCFILSRSVMSILNN